MDTFPCSNNKKSGISYTETDIKAEAMLVLKAKKKRNGNIGEDKSEKANDMLLSFDIVNFAVRHTPYRSLMRFPAKLNGGVSCGRSIRIIGFQVARRIQDSQQMVLGHLCPGGSVE